VKYREEVPVKASFKGSEYWRRPVAGFGDARGSLVIIGLAPAANGGNRTGRVFTGDESGRFLVNALYNAGFANQPLSESRDDGLRLFNCYLTAAVKCAPPGNKPTRKEFQNCSRYLNAELELLNASCVLTLGQLALRAFLDYARAKGVDVKHVRFMHGARYELKELPVLYISYHPSPRNTYTGKLKEGMLLKLLLRIKRDLRIH
jgi:uracil-DNA glycosylase family 4